MDKKQIDRIVWWIPFRNLRNFIRDYFNLINTISETNIIIKNVAYINSTPTFESKSQFNQDIEAYMYFKKLNNGLTDYFYVDIGAYDGVILSNTHMLEQLGWDGISVEANPRVFNRLKNSRKCSLYNVAITDTTNSSVDFMDDENADVLSGLSKDITKEHRDRMSDKINYIKVPTMTFDDLMKKHNRTHIDFLSLDVEGGELTILKSIDFSKYTFSLMTIENNEADNILADFMNEKGYKPYKNLGCDIMFIPK